MTTTILGANGKIGAILAFYARRSGLGWRTQARQRSADIQWSGAFDDPATPDIIQRGGTLINMIGATSGEEHEMHETNVDFVQTLLETAAKHGVAHVVLASSATVYGGGNGKAFVETDTLRPSIPYGVSKAAMERVAMNFAHQTAPAITILRISNVAGADALSAAASRHISNATVMPLHRFADGTAPTRSYIAPHDLFRAVAAFSAPYDGPPRIVNIAHPQPVRLDEMLAAYQSHVLPALKWADSAAPDGTPRSVTLDTSEMARLIEFQEHDAPADAFAAQLAEYKRS